MDRPTVGQVVHPVQLPALSQLSTGSQVVGAVRAIVATQVAGGAVHLEDPSNVTLCLAAAVPVTRWHVAPAAGRCVGRPRAACAAGRGMWLPAWSRWYTRACPVPGPLPVPEWVPLMVWVSDATPPPVSDATPPRCRMRHPVSDATPGLSTGQAADQTSVWCPDAVASGRTTAGTRPSPGSDSAWHGPVSPASHRPGHLRVARPYSPARRWLSGRSGRRRWRTSRACPRTATRRHRPGGWRSPTAPASWYRLRGCDGGPRPGARHSQAPRQQPDTLSQGDLMDYGQVVGDALTERLVLASWAVGLEFRWAAHHSSWSLVDVRTLDAGPWSWHGASIAHPRRISPKTRRHAVSASRSMSANGCTWTAIL